MEVLEPTREDSFLCANYQAAYDALVEAEAKAKAYVAQTYTGTTQPSIYLSALTPLRVQLEATLRQLQRENKIWVQKERVALETLTLKEIASSEELQTLESLHREYTQNEQALAGVDARVKEIEVVFAKAAAARSKDDAPAKPPKNAAALDAEKTALITQKEQKVGVLEKIKKAFLAAKEKVVAFVQKMKERGFLEKALQLRKDFAKAWEFAQKLFGEGKELVNEIKEVLEGVANPQTPTLQVASANPETPAIESEATDNNYKP
jgi:hypothetical protein